MCGIAGVINFEPGRPVERQLLARMCDAIVHRGPDGSGYFVSDGVGLGHRRLSIIDLEGGAQPMANADNSVVVTYNGEIYNYRELRAQLEARGYVFRTQSDTEVVVHGWSEWGADCVRHYNGMFAFAVWDARRKCLFLARDRLGIKPLHYAVVDGDALIFASELKALLAHPRLQRQLDERAVEDYMALGYVPEPRTILASVSKLEPGHTLLVDQRQGASLQPQRYWDLPCTPLAGAGEAELGEELLRQLDLAVQRRMIADVPLGAFLSGGVDSSAVVASMSKLAAEPVLTCSIAFRDRNYDESIYAQRVAEKFNTDHYSREVAADDFSLIDDLAQVYDEPFADSSAIPTFRVCAVARQKVKVALSGDGADESFAGYRRYRWHCHEERVRRSLPRRLRQPLFGTLARVYPKLDWAPSFLRAKTTFSALSSDSVDAYFDSVSRCAPAVRAALYEQSFARRLQGYSAVENFHSHAARSPVADGLGLVQYLDFKTWLPGDILTKVDRASMANSLEVRVPFLDHEFVEWASGLPAAYKLRGRDGKYLLKTALRSRLDKDLLYRRKMGFSVPLAEWLRGPARAEAGERLGASRLGQLGVFDVDRVQNLLERHASGQQNNATVLWSLLMFENTVSRIFSLR
ncbi:MAG: amidotransferase 1, exosortase A system-associated [Gammaproteobacteria bacterium]|nr:amidotransferase 1, exosortase A system-associated [Gammaproteobacteria bacterium]